MSRRPEEEALRIARKVVADEVMQAVATFYGPSARVDHYETNTGLEQIRLDLGEGVVYHVTVTRARK